MMIRAATFGLLLTMAVGAWSLAAGQAPTSLDPRLPDGRHLHLSCAGRGQPLVLMESGFGAKADAWYKVQPALSRRTRTCAYDRAGYGQSDPGPEPRDGAAIARDLDDALRAAAIKGPFVMVGHSAGGLYVRIFADRRPREVVGMVLVDPSVEYQDRQLSMFGPNAGSVAPIMTAVRRCLDIDEGRLSDDGPPNPGTARCYARTPTPGLRGERLPASLWRTELSELDTLWRSTSDEVAAGRAAYGALPLVVLTAGDTYKGTREPLKSQVDARWSQVHQDVARRSSRGVERVIAGASHLIMIDRPDAVIQAVEEVLDQAAAN